MTNEVQAAAVSIKLPTFWTKRAEVWFIQAEAQFTTRGITADDTKYHYVVAALDEDTATRIIDLLTSPPSDSKYTALKERLLRTFTFNDRQRAAKLLALPGIGDNTPSQLMDSMLALLGEHKPCFLFKELFMQQLPDDIQAHLVRSEITDYRELALAADQLWLARSSSNIHPLQRRVVKEKSPSVSVSSPSSNEFCYYHTRFGKVARQCRPPCNYPVSGNGQAGRH